MTTTPQHSSPTEALEDLLDVLDLKPLGSARIRVDGPAGDVESDLGGSDADVFVGRSIPMPHGRAYGGQVLAQSIIAAGRTVGQVEGGPRHIHSLHGYFLRPGDDGHPIRFTVERLRDGRSFSARRVYAIQYGKPILSMITSFQTDSGGLDHHDPMPDVPPAESLPNDDEQLGGAKHPVSEGLDLRHVDSLLFRTPGPELVSHQSVWLKTVGTLPDDPLLHAAMLAYCSDFSLLEPVLRRHGLAWSDPRLRVASLDHAMWFHRPLRADQWTLYSQDAPSASGGRGLARGRMFCADGRLVASVAQEGMTRVKD